MPGNSRRMPETKARSVANAYWGGRWFQFGSNSSITEQVSSNAFVLDGSVRIEPGTYTVTLKIGRWEGRRGARFWSPLLPSLSSVHAELQIAAKDLLLTQLAGPWNRRFIGDGLLNGQDLRGIRGHPFPTHPVSPQCRGASIQHPANDDLADSAVLARHLPVGPARPTGPRNIRERLLRSWEGWSGRP